MATVTELAEALRAVVDAGLTDVDQVTSVGSYTPALATENRLIISTHRQRRGVAGLVRHRPRKSRHEIPLELWTKFTNDPPP